MSEKLTPREIWDKYQKDVSYKHSLKLFDNVKRQENFFLGRQWEGVNAPDLPQPVLNFIKRVVNYLISVLVVDDIGIAFRGYKPQQLVDAVTAVTAVLTIEDVLPVEVERVNENVKFKAKLRQVVHNMAVDGDTALYVRFDPDICSGSDAQVGGEIQLEHVDNTNIHFENPMTSEVEEQPSIILSKLKLTKELRRQYPELAERIRADGDENNVVEYETSEEVTTVLIYLYKQDGKVWFCECTQDVFLKDPVNTEQNLYPVAYTSWEKVKNQYHGVGVVEETIPNQIEVNKLWAMAFLFQKHGAFPITFIDKTKVDKWNPKPGAVLGVVGNPNDAIATSFKAHDMSNQILQIVERTIELTKEFMGANDAVLGNINPQNTSALIQVQKASAAPLELQKLSLYQFIEDYVRIVVDIMRAKYGIRLVQTEHGEALVDFSKLDYNKNFSVDIGASAYFSETAQIETMNNLYTAGILQDAKLLVESMPDKLLPNKNKILQSIEKYEAKQQALMQQQMALGGMTNEM